MSKLYIEREVVEQALKLAANRLARVALELPHGSAMRYEANSWAQEAEAALSAAAEPATGWVLQEVRFDEAGIPFQFRDPAEPVPAVPDASPAAPQDDAEIENILSNAAQLIQGFKQDWERQGCWSEWDQSVLDMIANRSFAKWGKELIPMPNEHVPLGVIAAIRHAGLNLLKTERGYELRKLGEVTAQSAPQAAPQGDAVAFMSPKQVPLINDELRNCADDYRYLISITENKENLHGWLRMRIANIELAAAKAAQPETQGERTDLANALKSAAEHLFSIHMSYDAERCLDAAALLSAGPARVEPLSQKYGHED